MKTIYYYETYSKNEKHEISFLVQGKVLYRLDKIFINGVFVQSLFCKVLEDYRTYETLFSQFYISKNHVLCLPVMRQATDTLDIMKIDKGKFQVFFKIPYELYIILKMKADDKNDFNWFCKLF